MKLSFTTLGCPDWSWETILKEAARLGYDGIELRGIEGEFFLPKARPFLKENITDTMEQLRKINLEICVLDTSSSFHDEAQFETALAEAKATIDLAVVMGVPYIRVFGNEVPDRCEKQKVLERVARGIREACLYCESKNVDVLLETHGDFSQLDHLMPVIEMIDSRHFGVLWDVEHTYTLYGEDNSAFFKKTAKYIKHTHIKDTRKDGNGFKLCLTGEGNVPFKKDIELLQSIGYKGYLSFEWEKKWHAELEEPEIAIPGYIDYMKRLLG